MASVSKRMRVKRTPPIPCIVIHPQMPLIQQAPSSPQTQQIVFVPHISDGVFESFYIKITICDVTYVSESFTGNDCPPYFKGRLCYYMAALEEAKYRKNYKLVPRDYETKLSATFYYGADMDIPTSEVNEYHILLTKQKI